MKKLLQKSIFAAALCLFAVGVNAQSPSITNVGVKAMLANQLTVTKAFDVDFGGIFIPIDADATASLDYQGKVTITRGDTGLFATTSQQQGVLTVAANEEATFSIQYPATANLTSGNNTIVYTPKLYNKTGSLIPSSSTTTYNIDTDEDGDGSAFSKIINIGGDLVVPFEGFPGTYLGNIDVTVTWQ